MDMQNESSFLTCLTKKLVELTEVKMLDCSNNQLTEVPASLSQMSSLEQLYLRHNKLNLLPILKSPVLKVSTARFPAWFVNEVYSHL